MHSATYWTAKQRDRIRLQATTDRVWTPAREMPQQLGCPVSLGMQDRPARHFGALEFSTFSVSCYLVSHAAVRLAFFNRCCETYEEPEC